MDRSILIVEDSPEDYETLLRSFRKVGLDQKFVRCRNGDEAISMLEEIDDEQEDSPALILLDLNLPGTSGLQVLEHIKGIKTLRHIPVIIMTTSNNERDIRQSYDNGANSYIQKPVDFEDTVRVARLIKDYWFDCAKLPD